MRLVLFYPRLDLQTNYFTTRYSGTPMRLVALHQSVCPVGDPAFESVELEISFLVST